MNCQQLARDVDRLRRENAKLLRLIQSRLAVVRKQKRLLDGARVTAWWHVCQAKKVLDKPSGVPRHEWATARGRAWAAGKLWGVLIYDYTAALAEWL